MDRAWTWVKEHPYITAIIVFVVGLFIILFFFRGGSSAPVDNTAAQLAAAQASEAAYGNQLATTQVAGQVATNQTNAEAATAQAQIASQERVAQIAADASTTNATIAANSAKDVATITGTTTLGVSTINANLAAKQTTLGVLDNLYQTLVKQNPAWVINSTSGAQHTSTDSTGVGGGGYTHSESGMTFEQTQVGGSYGQGVSGSLGDTSFALNITPLVSKWTPWGATQPLATAPNLPHAEINDNALLLSPTGT